MTWHTLCVEEYQWRWCYFDKLEADREINDKDEVGEIGNCENDDDEEVGGDD